MLNNKVITVGEVDLIFSTMWSEIKIHTSEILRGMNDFNYIKYDNRKLTISDYNEIHQKSFDFIKKSVISNNKKIVVTHLELLIVRFLINFMMKKHISQE